MKAAASNRSVDADVVKPRTDDATVLPLLPPAPFDSPAACDAKKDASSPTQVLDADQLTKRLDSSRGVPIDAPCPAGLSLTVYDSDMSKHYAIPSEHVQITRGAIKYVDHHARYGAQTRFRFQLCHNFLLRKCPKLSECSYIHATQLPAPTQVHLNPFAPRRSSANRQVASATHDDPNVAHTYPTLPKGLFVPVFPPVRGPRDATGDEPDRVSANAAVVVVPSEQLIVTAGAEELIRMLDDLPEQPIGSALKSSPSAAASVMETLPPAVLERARHCAHYQFKRLCNLGAGCQYIHSKVPLLTTAKAQQLHNQHQSYPQQQSQYQHHQPHQQYQYQPGPVLQQDQIDAAAFAAGMNAAMSTGFAPGMQIPPPAFLASMMAPPPAARSTAGAPPQYAPAPFQPPQAPTFAVNQATALQQPPSSTLGPPPYAPPSYTPSYNTPGFSQPQPQQFPPAHFHHAQVPPPPPQQPFYPQPEYRTSGPPQPLQVQPTATPTSGQPQGHAPAAPSGYFSSSY
jgi:hypothetical protein